MYTYVYIHTHTHMCVCIKIAAHAEQAHIICIHTHTHTHMYPQRKLNRRMIKGKESAGREAQGVEDTPQVRTHAN